MAIRRNASNNKCKWRRRVQCKAYFLNGSFLLFNGTCIQKWWWRIAVRRSVTTIHVPHVATVILFVFFFYTLDKFAVIFCTALPVWAAVEKNEKRTITQEAICMMLGCNMLTESPSDFVSPMFAVCYRCVLWMGMTMLWTHLHEGLFLCKTEAVEFFKLKWMNNCFVFWCRAVNQNRRSTHLRNRNFCRVVVSDHICGWWLDIGHSVVEKVGGKNNDQIPFCKTSARE